MTASLVAEGPGQSRPGRSRSGPRSHSVRVADLAGWTQPLGSSTSPVHEPATGRPLHVVALDFGMKWNIARHLVDEGCRVTIVPGTLTADEILALEPDGVFLSNGPGDPEPVEYAIRTIGQLLGQRPIFGICLGHQLMALACGAKTFKLKFGHRGANQPVLNLEPARWRSPPRTTGSRWRSPRCLRTW